MWEWPGREANPKLESAVRTAVQLAIVLLVLATGSFAVTVTVTSPTSGSSSGSPVHFVASASSGVTVSSMMIYVDNKAVYTVYSNKLDTYIPMSTGSHYVNVKSWDASGAMGVTSFNMSVTSSGTSYNNVDQMSGWAVCTNCAGYSGQQDAPSSFAQFQGSPSMDGASMKFSIGGTTPYSNALWHRGFGANGYNHFVYDVYFYITNPSAAEALEFDINLYRNGKQYIFGHQCSPKWSHTWDTWNQYTGHWETTGIACPTFTGYKWNHVQIEVERTWDSQLHYVAITYNGVKNYVNRYRQPTGTSWNGFSIDYQMDGDGSQTDYSTWLDKLNVYQW